MVQLSFQRQLPLVPLVISLLASQQFHLHRSIASAFQLNPIPTSHIVSRAIPLQLASSEDVSVGGSEGSALFKEKLEASRRAKQALFDALDDKEDAATIFHMQVPTKERTALVAALTETNPTPHPGSTKSFASLAPGIWRVVYAPHIATFGMIVSKLLSALFSLSPLLETNDNTPKDSSAVSFTLGFDPVYYLLRPDGTMSSHARLVVQFPHAEQKSVTWFSVAGTYSSQDDDRVCRVDFDQAWVQSSKEDAQDNTMRLPPIPTLDEVPPSLGKSIINALGRFFFIDAVSVFPVSFLDDECIVFDFELLGTRICARKMHNLEDEEGQSYDPVLQFLADKES